MSTSSNFPYFGTPFVDPGTGLVTAPWTRFLIDLWNRTGGGGDSDNPNLTQLETLLQNVDSPLQTQAVSEQLQLFEDGELRQTPPFPLNTLFEDQSPKLVPAITETFFEDQSTQLQTPDLGLLGDGDDVVRDPPLGIVPSNFFATWDGPITITTVLGAADRIYLHPFYIPVSARLTALAVRVITGGAGSAAKAGIWANKNARPVGTPIIVDNTGVATTAAGIATFTISATNVRRGWYWFGLKCTSATRPVFLNISATTTRLAAIIGGNTAANTLNTALATQLSGFYFGNAYANNMPDLTGAGLTAIFGATQGNPVGIYQLS